MLIEVHRCILWMNKTTIVIMTSYIDSGSNKRSPASIHVSRQMNYWTAFGVKSKEEQSIVGSRPIFVRTLKKISVRYCDEMVSDVKTQTHPVVTSALLNLSMNSVLNQFPYVCPPPNPQYTWPRFSIIGTRLILFYRPRIKINSSSFFYRWNRALLSGSRESPGFITFWVITSWNDDDRLTIGVREAIVQKIKGNHS